MTDYTSYDDSVINALKKSNVLRDNPDAEMISVFAPNFDAKTMSVSPAEAGRQLVAYFTTTPPYNNTDYLTRICCAGALNGQCCDINSNPEAREFAIAYTAHLTNYLMHELDISLETLIEGTTSDQLLQGGCSTNEQARAAMKTHVEPVLSELG